MSILVNKKSKIVVQGITGSEGTFHTTQMIEYGTNVVAGVTPGKGGLTYTIPLKKPLKKQMQMYLSFLYLHPLQQMLL